MNKPSSISGTGNKSTQVGTTPREKNPISTIILLVLGASFFVLVVLTIALYQQFIATREYGITTLFLGMLAIAVFLLLSALLSLRFRTMKAKPARDKVLDALISTLQQKSNDPDARLAAVKGLAELDLEESAEHMHHADIDTILISALKDDDSRVSSAAAEGLSVVELEKCSFHHTHDRLDDTLLKHGIAD